MSETPGFNGSDLPYDVELLLANGDEIRGTLTLVYADEGQTDGLLQVREHGRQDITNVYERHILWVRKVLS